MQKVVIPYKLVSKIFARLILKEFPLPPLIINYRHHSEQYPGITIIRNLKEFAGRLVMAGILVFNIQIPIPGLILSIILTPQPEIMKYVSKSFTRADVKQENAG